MKQKLAAAALFTLPLFLLRVNVSSSLPRGIYLRLPARQIVPGALVALCLPAEAAALYRAHAHAPVGSCPDRLPPFLKAVAVSSGDEVAFGPRGLSVNGRLLPASAPRRQDSAGRPLPHPPFGTYRLEPGSLWLYAPHPLSFDSRYFGPQPASAVLYRLAPIWLFSDPSPLVRLHLFSDHLDWEPFDA